MLAIAPGGEHVDRMRPELTAVTAVALDGVEPGKVVLAAREGNHNPLLKAFEDLSDLVGRPRARGEPV